MPENGREIDLVAKLHVDPASLIRTQKEIDAALQGSGKNLQMERDALRVRDDHAKATARQIQLERELSQQKAKSSALDSQATDIANRLAKARAEEAVAEARVTELKERSNTALARQIDLANRIRDRRKSGGDAQELRGQQLQNIKEIQDAEADLVKGRGDLEKATSRVGKLEGDLGNVRTSHANVVKELNQLENESAATRQRLTKLDRDHIAVSQKLSQTYVEQREHLRRLHREEQQGGRRRPERRTDPERPRSGGGSGGGGGRGGGGGGHLYRNASAFGDLFRSVPGSVGGPLGAILGPLALADAVSYAEALTTAGQAMAALPAVASAAGAAIGTLALGMHGFEDTLKNLNDPKKFVEAIEHLAPAAQQAALEIQSLVQGPLGQLQRLVQEDLFKGVAGQIDGLATSFGPELKGLTTGIATAFNGMFSNFTGALENNHGSIDVIVNNIVSAFQRLEPAVKPFTDALVTITQVGSGFLPQIADSISNMATSFNTFIQKAANDGSLQSFIQKGIDAIGVLGQAALDLSTKLFDLFGNQSPEELRKNINDIVDTMVTLATVVQDVAHAINDWKPLLEAVGVGFAIFKAGGWVVESLAKMGGMLGAAEAGGIGAGLAAIPAAAETAGAGIVAGLGPAALMLSDLAIAAGVVVGAMELLKDKPQDLDNPAQRFMNANPNMPKVPDLGPDGPSRNFMLQHPELWPTNPAAPKAPGSQGADGPGYHDKEISDYRKFMPQLSIQLPPGMQTLPGVSVAPGAPAPLPGTAGAMFPGSPGARPQLQYGTDGTPFAHPELGYRKVNPAELSNSGAELQKAAVELGRANAELDAVQKSSMHTQQELLDAQMKQADAQRGFNEKQLDYAKNSMGKWTKVDANMAVFGEIGAHLDKDLGFSKGLPGLADNLVKFVASLATAPMMGKLAQEASIGDGSYGALGMMFGGYGSKTGVGPETFTNSGVMSLGGASASASSNINDLASAAANATRAMSGQPSGSPGGSSAPAGGGGWWPNLAGLSGAPQVNLGSGPYAGIAATDTSKSGLAQYGGIPGAESGMGENVLAYMQGVMNDFNQKTGSKLSVTADYPGGPTGHPDDGGDHSARRALDVSGNDSDMNAFAAYVANNPALRAATRQLIHNPGSSGGPFNADMNVIGGHLTNGWQTYGSGGEGMPGHLNHDHWALQYIPAMDQATSSLNNLSAATSKAAASVQGDGSSGSTGQDATLATALKSNGFTDSQITGLTALNGVETGNWSHPESTMGFTNQQTGPGIDAHVAGFKGMWDKRQSSGAVVPAGHPESGQDAQGNVVDPAKYAKWLLKLEGYSATTDWAGNKYAPGQFMSDDAYASSVTKAYQPRSLPTGGGQGLPIPAGPKLDFSGTGGGGGGDPFGFSKTPTSPSSPIADLLHSSKPGDLGFSKAPGSPSNNIADFLHSAPPAGPGAGPAKQYTPQQQPEEQQGWQPQGGGGVGIGGGALGAAMSAGSMAADVFAPGAGAAAQTAMQLTNRSIKFGGQVAGIAAEGLLDTFMPSDPDTGKNPIKDSWLWRAAGALAGAAPALGSGAGLMDRAALKKQQDEAQSQQGASDNSTSHNYNAPLVNIGNLVQGNNQSGKSLSQDIAQNLYLNAGNQFGGQP